MAKSFGNNRLPILQVAPQKHACPDCMQCQFCSDPRCAVCRGQTTRVAKKLSMAEQIALYERLNAEDES